MKVLELGTPHGPARVHLYLADEPLGAVMLGHGAGGGVGAKDITTAAKAALAAGFSVALVEQPYRVAGRRTPPRAPLLDEDWTSIATQLCEGELDCPPLITGGRSSGARVACRTARATNAAGVLCLAFPLHPPQRKNGAGARPSRLEELEAVDVPTLVVQGASDPFGMPPRAPNRLVVEVKGDHRLQSDLQSVAAAVHGWLPQVLRIWAATRA